MVFIIESQVTYIVDAVKRLRADGIGALEPRQDAQDDWNDGLQRRLGRTVWNTGGCSSWYLDAHGKNTVLWPGTTFSFRGSLARFDIDAYDVTPAPITARVHEGVTS